MCSHRTRLSTMNDPPADAASAGMPKGAPDAAINRSIAVLIVRRCDGLCSVALAWST